MAHELRTTICCLRLVLCAALSAGALLRDRVLWLHTLGLSALTLAIMLGLVVGNHVFPRWVVRCAPGVLYAKQYMLRLGIILYGFRLSFSRYGVCWLGRCIDRCARFNYNL